MPLLADHFNQHFARRHARPPARLGPEFIERLLGHHWPGNIRELGNFMQRVLSLSDSGDLTAASFDREHRPSRPSLVGPATGPVAVPSGTPRRPAPFVSMDELERSHLERTLELVEGNRTRAAEMLGLSVRTIRNKIRQYDLPPRRYA